MPLQVQSTPFALSKHIEIQVLVIFIQVTDIQIIIKNTKIVSIIFQQFFLRLFFCNHFFLCTFAI